MWHTNDQVPSYVKGFLGISKKNTIKERNIFCSNTPQMASKQLSFIIKDMNIKIARKYYFSSIGLAKTKNSYNIQCWWGLGKQALLHSWWVHKFVQPLSEDSVWQSLQKFTSTIWPRNFSYRIYLHEYTKMYKKMFTVASFMAARKLEIIQCL